MKENSIPKVSIIFPIYNNEAYIEKCIRSVMNQTLSEIEMILIDDGSTDSAPSICDYLAGEDARIKVVHKKNEGVAIGENVGLDMAQGEYIGFVEADDCIAKTMYEKLYNCAKKTDADVVKCGFYYCERDLKREVRSLYSIAEEGETFKAEDKPGIFLQHASMWAGIYRREFIEEHKLRNIVTPSATYSDFTWTAMNYAYAEKIAIVPEPLYYYTYDNPNSSRVQEGEKCFYKIFHCKEANKILREAGIFDAVKEELGYQEFCTCLGHARRIKKKLRKEYFSKYKELLEDITKDGYNFSKFIWGDKRLARLILSGEEDKFYKKIEVKVKLMSFVERYKWADSLWWKLKKIKYAIVR